MVAAIESGFPQREIERRAMEHQRAVESGARVIVGVNRFTDGAEAAPPALQRIDPAIEVAQQRALAELRAARDGAAAHQALDALREAARGTQNLLPFILAAVKARATLGEVSDVFREVFGEYRTA